MAEAFISTLTNAFQTLEQEYLEKLEKQENTIKQLQQRIDELEHYDRIDDYLAEIDQNERKYQTESDNIIPEEVEYKEDKKKDRRFWKYLVKKLKEGDIEYVKELVRNSEIKMNECNDDGRNLLMLGTSYGSYELVSMCINLGADIDKEDTSKMTALKIAKKRGFPYI
eukprot:122151_1